MTIGISSLPAEIILEIFNLCNSCTDKQAFARTNRRHFSIFSKYNINQVTHLYLTYEESRQPHLVKHVTIRHVDSIEVLHARLLQLLNSEYVYWQRISVLTGYRLNKYLDIYNDKKEGVHLTLHTKEWNLCDISVFVLRSEVDYNWRVGKVSGSCLVSNYFNSRTPIKVRNLQLINPTVSEQDWSNKHTNKMARDYISNIEFLLSELSGIDERISLQFDHAGIECFLSQLQMCHCSAIIQQRMKKMKTTLYDLELKVLIPEQKEIKGSISIEWDVRENRLSLFLNKIGLPIDLLDFFVKVIGNDRLKYITFYTSQSLSLIRNSNTIIERFLYPNKFEIRYLDFVYA